MKNANPCSLAGVLPQEQDSEPMAGQFCSPSSHRLLTVLSSGSCLGKTLALFKCFREESTAGRIIFLCLGCIASLQLEISEFG